MHTTRAPNANRLAAATAKAERMLAAAPIVGIDLYDLELVRRRLARHEANYNHTSRPSKRQELVRLMDEEIGTLASAYKKLEAAAFGRSATR
jgi:hypothetical protein